MNLEVFIQNDGQSTPVGLLRTYDRGETVSFEYLPDWLKAGYSIDPSVFPLCPGLKTAPRLAGAFADCGPDRWGKKLISRAAEKGLIPNKPIREINYLLVLDDRTRIGALRFRHQGESNFLAGYQGGIPSLLHLERLIKAASAVNQGTEDAQDLSYLLSGGSPLGGSRPKSAILLLDGRFAIAKLPRDKDRRDIAAGEVLALELARRCGLVCAEAQYKIIGKQPVSIITRFDRDGENRIPFVSAATLLQRPSGDGASYEAIAEGIRQFGSPDDVPEIWKRCLFSLLICNQDDHLRNHGFLMIERNVWHLSPAYDLNPVPETDRAHHHQTRIREESQESNIEIALARKFHL